MSEICYVDISVKEAPSVPFASQATLLGRNIIFWDPQNIVAEIRANSSTANNGTKLLGQDGSRILAELFERRKEEIERQLEAGRMIAIVPSNINDIFYNPLNPTQFQVASLLPDSLHFTCTAGVGNNAQFTADRFSREFEKAYPSSIVFDGKLTLGRNWKPLAHVNGHPEQPVAAYAKHGKGLIFLLPRTSDMKVLAEQLKKIFASHSNSTPIETLPEWATKITFPEELPIIENIKKISDQIKDLEQKKQATVETLGVFNDYRALVGAKGAALASAVTNVFSKLATKVHSIDHRRTDLTIKFNNETAVVEIKGSVGSSGEKDSRQLEAWRGDHKEVYNHEPKGILVVNGYYLTPLDKRKDETFPSQMIPYATRNFQCLITGQQLLDEYLSVLRGKQTRDEVMQNIFDTSGKFISKIK